MSAEDVRAYIHRSIRLMVDEFGVDNSHAKMSELLGADRWHAIYEGEPAYGYELIVLAEAFPCSIFDLIPYRRQSILELEHGFARLTKQAGMSDGKGKARIITFVEKAAEHFEKQGSVLLIAVAAGALATTSIGWWRAHDAYSETRSAHAELLTGLEQQANANIQAGRALAREGEQRAAGQAFAQAVETARSRVEGTDAASPQSLNALFDLAQAVFWQADYHYRLGETELAATAYEEYASIGNMLATAAPENPIYLAERAWGYHNLAIIEFERGRLDAALEGFSRARDQFLTLIDTNAGITVAEIADTVAWIADTRFQQGRFSEADIERRYELQLYSQIENPSYRVQFKSVHALRARAQIALLTNRVGEADELTITGLDWASRLLDENPGDERAVRHYASLLNQRASVLIAQGDLIGAKFLIDRAPARLMHELDGDWIPPWRASALIALSAANIANEMGAHEITIREAQNASRHLSRAHQSYVDTPRLMARAYELLGDGWRLAGNDSEARAAWRLGIRALEGSPSHPIEQAILARLAHRLGEEQIMLAARLTVLESEYAQPMDITYWAEAESAASVQLQRGNP